MVTNKNIFLQATALPRDIDLLCTSWTYGYLTAPHDAICLIYRAYLGLNWVMAFARLLIGREIPGVLHTQRRVNF